MKPPPAAAPRYDIPANVPKESLGYYNAQRVPIAFTSNYAGRGVTNLDPGQPIVSVTGELVKYDPDCERLVSEKLLKRILPGDPNYNKFLALDERARKQQHIVTMPADLAPVGPQAAPSDESPKEEFTTTVEDGVTYYVADGKKFTSLTAVKSYLANAT